jgi:hypothetical protein
MRPQPFVIGLLAAGTLALSATASGAATVTLTVTVSGKGTVVSSPAGISCPRRCRIVRAKGAIVLLTARPAVGWRFAGWAGGCRSQTNPRCRVGLKISKSVRARFTVSAPPPPPPPTPPPSTFAPQTLAGTWSGTWQNTRTGTSGPGTIRFQAPDPNSMIFTFNLGGAFGCSSWTPVAGPIKAGTGPNTWNTDGFNFQATDPPGGTLSVNYDAVTQTLTGNGRPGCRPGITWSLRGTFSGGTFTGTMTITFEDGSTAAVTISLTRPAPP